MSDQENKSRPNQKEVNEEPVESLLNYEYDDDDDGTDWET